LQSRIGAVVDDLHIEIADEQLVLFGSVASYYLKQMVQVVVAEIFRGSMLNRTGRVVMSIMHQRGWHY